MVDTTSSISFEGIRVVIVPFTLCLVQVFSFGGINVESREALSMALRC